MGRYIDKILQPGEKVLYSANPHWIFYLPALGLWIIVAAVAGLTRIPAVVAVDPRIETGLLGLAAVIGLFALYLTLKAWFHRWTTETDVTSLRLVHKTGFIQRRTFEMSLDKIESVDLDQSILGRVLNYGDVTVLGVGEGRETIKTISAPLAFRNSITAR
jgi:uncharacterized membrane protein YdbT with pleckstrin-like domain